MEKYLQNIFDDFDVKEADDILTEVKDVYLPKEREELRSRILKKVGIKDVTEMPGERYRKRYHARTLRIRNAAACFVGIIIISAVSVYAYSGKSLFEFFLQQQDDEAVGDYVGYDGDTMSLDRHQIKIDSCLFDEAIGGGYCVITVQGKNSTDEELKKFLDYEYIGFSFFSDSVIVGMERTIQDGIVYIPIIFTQSTDQTDGVKFCVIGGSDYVQEKGGVIDKDAVETIIYNEDDSIAGVELGYLNVETTKKLQNKQKLFQSDAKLSISAIGLMIDNLDVTTIDELSIEYQNGEKEFFVKDRIPVSDDILFGWSTNRSSDPDFDEAIYSRHQLLFGKVIDLDSVSKAYINGEEIDLS